MEQHQWQKNSDKEHISMKGAQVTLPSQTDQDWRIATPKQTAILKRLSSTGAIVKLNKGTEHWTYKPFVTATIY